MSAAALRMPLHTSPDAPRFCGAPVDLSCYLEEVQDLCQSCQRAANADLIKYAVYYTDESSWNTFAAGLPRCRHALHHLSCHPLLLSCSPLMPSMLCYCLLLLSLCLPCHCCLLKPLCLFWCPSLHLGPHLPLLPQCR